MSMALMMVTTKMSEEQVLATNDPVACFHYARDVIKGRWVEAESVIMQDVGVLRAYISEVIEGRGLCLDAKQAYHMAVERAEIFGAKEGLTTAIKNHLLTCPESAYQYAKEVIKGRWADAEAVILSQKHYYDVAVVAFNYAKEVIKGRWIEAEPAIMKDARIAFYYAKEVMKGRWIEAEPYIAKHSWYAYDYAEQIIQGRFPEAEQLLLEDAAYQMEANEYFGVMYAEKCIKGRWIELENSILNPEIVFKIGNKADAAFRYALTVIKGRWIEAEPLILENPLVSAYYAINFIKGRWIEAEPLIFLHPEVLSDYLDFLHTPEGEFPVDLQAVEDCRDR